MPDVFISYAREDQDFVRKLHGELEQRHRDTWVDWKDIPLTAKWWEEVCHGIESTDTFAFVISPDSLDSDVCRQELDHAAANNKRLAPIWHRDVDDEAVPPELASHQYIWFRETDDFEEASERLTEALDTDLEWVRAHTRLLVRAKEWETEKRDSSFLLRGRDLESAEALQVMEAEKEPKLTLLQKEYIYDSRREATRLRRRLLETKKLGKLGGLALLLSSALFITSALVQIYFSVNPASFTLTAYTLQALIAVIAAPLNLSGVLVLYARWLQTMGTFGFVAFLITYTGSVLAAGVYWYGAFAAPSIASIDYNVFSSLWNNPPFLLLLGSQSAFQLVALGWLLLGIVILRARLYSRSIVVTLVVASLFNWGANVLGLVLYLIGTTSIASYMGIVTTIVNILWNAAIGWLGYALLTDKKQPE